MAKIKNEEEVSVMLDTTVEEEAQVVIPVGKQVVEKEEKEVVSTPSTGDMLNCLKNERIIVRHINKQVGNISNPKHILFGGMATDALRKFSVPKLTNGSYVNVLTNNEKEFLEMELGLERNALSIHKKNDNFWDDSNNNGVSQVILFKEDNFFDLSKPTDYIKYKILLANKNIICPSLRELQDRPKATYLFVIINEGDETKSAKQNMTTLQRCYKEFGKIEEDIDTLRVVIETITGRPVAANTKLDWLQTKANELIQGDSRLFLATITDEYLSTKVLIKKATQEGLILYKGDQLYLREGNMPLCEYGQEPTLNVAARYLNNPKHQDILFALQAKLK